MHSAACLLHICGAAFLSAVPACARIGGMTSHSHRQAPAPDGSITRRSTLSLSTGLAAILVLALLLAFGSASLAVYRWARTTAAALPSLQAITAPDLPAPSTEPAVLPGSTPTASAAPAGAANKTNQTQPEPTPAPGQRVTILLLGVDQRPDDPVPLLTDTMIVVTINTVTGHIGMISLPRDLFVPIAEYGRSGKINTAFMVGQENKYPGGGGALSKRTVSEFLGYPIDYYVMINFDGFVQAIDAIGGIDVVVPATIHDVKYPTIDYGLQTFHIEAGPQHLDGETALKYARTRQSSDDFQRSRRQIQVIMAAKDKLIENKLLTPVRLLELLRVVSNSVKDDIPTTQLPGLLALASQADTDAIEQLVIDDRYAQIDARSKFGWIMIPNRAKIRPAVDQIFTGQSTPDPAELQRLAEQQARQQAAQARQQAYSDYQSQAELLRAQLGAEGARISLENGTGDAALTARAADWLQRQGYVVTQATAADRSDYSRTMLIAYGDKPVAVNGLTSMFAIAPANIRQDRPSAANPIDIRLIIGRDFYLLVSN